VTTTLRTSQEPAPEDRSDAIIVGVVEGPDGPRPAPGAEEVAAALDGQLAPTLRTLGARGKREEITKIASAGRLGAPLVVAVGLGPDGQPAFDGETLRRAAGAAVRALGTSASADSGSAAAATIALALPARNAAEAEAVALGALLGGYTFDRYRSGAGRPDRTLTLLADGAHASQPAARAKVLADAVMLVRDLVNTSAADLYPETFAAEAERVAKASGLQIEVLDEQALAHGGYGGIIGVGQGSVHPPRLVRLAYRAPGATKTVAFAGKGITFDSGGLSLKPPKSMPDMKGDMGGAAAVLGALQAITALGPQVNVIGYLPLAENMPGGGAQRPSDVISIYGGKTVEVLNTDAEGRLILADTLVRAGEDDPDLVVDVATLTGAQVVALGPRICGVMGNDDVARDGVVAAARQAGEAAWPMPLPDELRSGLDSSVADLANVAGQRDGGMLVAGLFLKEFVPPGVRWVHVDIAGPSFNDHEPYGYTGKGGTGAATRTLVQVAIDVAAGRL
jgi:leucyl aminopeptidase